MQFRYRFIPTIYSYAINASKTGEPIIRPLYYTDFKNTKLYSADDSFYLGKDIFISPVFDKNADSKAVELPEGNWYNLWTKERHEGGKTLVVDCPLTKKEGLPMFVREGGGVAYQKQTMYFANDIPAELDIELYVSEDAQIELLESENVKNKFSCSVGKNSIMVSAENNTDMERTYNINIILSDKTYFVTKKVAKGTALHEEIKL